MRRALVALVALVGVLLVGCTSSTSAASAVKTTQVDLPPSYLFSPARVQVSPG
jgi:predicted component of type VI protein secretion system